jgi:hypothetical protein
MDHMELVPIADARLLERIEPEQGNGAVPCLDIELDARLGSLRIYDPRLFQARRRGFCERLLKAASRQPGIVKAEVEFASASCQIEFGPSVQTALCMADSFVCAVQEAAAGSSLLERIGWWQRPCRGWLAMTAFHLPDAVSLWDAFEIKPAQIRLRRRGATGNWSRLSRLADALAALDGVEACRVSRWSNQITIDISRDAPLSDRFLDTVEQATACLKAAELLPPALPDGRQPAKSNRLSWLFQRV